MKIKPFTVPSLLFILALTATSISCGDKDKDLMPADRFSATIDGESFLPFYVSGISDGETILFSGTMGKATDSFQLSVGITNKATVNTTLTNNNDDVYIRYYNWKGPVTYSSAARTGHATLTLTTLDKTNKRLEGTFSGVLYKHAADIDSMVITDGKFNIFYK